MPPSDDDQSPASRHRPALLTATVCGAVVATGAMFAGLHAPMMVGIFIFLACGFIYLATQPPKPKE